MKEDFLDKISDTIRIFSSSLDEEKEGMKLNIQNVHTEGNGHDSWVVLPMENPTVAKMSKIRVAR